MILRQEILDNGLKVLIREVHTAPVVSVRVWYRVGARYEKLGITGASHWVEHVLFRGTPRWPSGEADRAISRQGGVYNGVTSHDFTVFYETLPASSLALAIDIEADRMAYVTLDPSAIEKERAIIIAERQGNENSPMFRLTEEISATAYRVHPYGHMTIGHLCDLESMTTAEVQHHHATYYGPNNAIVTIAGDVDAERALAQVAQVFAPIPRGPDPREVKAVEPPQRGERQVVVRGAGSTNYLEIAYHAPPASDPDFQALTVLNAILSGGSGFVIGGGHTTNVTSRLYRALVDTRMVVDVGGYLTPTIDPGLLRFSATLAQDQQTESVIARFEEEIARLRSDPVHQSELEKAQRQAQALFAYASESISSQAFWLGFAEIVADQTWFENYLQDIASITADDIQRVAQQYLTPCNRTVGLYLTDKGEC